MAKKQKQEDIDDILNEGSKPEPVETKEEKLEQDDYELEQLIVEGKKALLTRKIKYHNIEDDKAKEMTVYISPISSTDYNKAQRTATNRQNEYSLEELICAKGWKNEEGILENLSKIRITAAGTVIAIANEIIKASGFIENDKDELINRILGF